MTANVFADGFNPSTGGAVPPLVRQPGAQELDEHRFQRRRRLIEGSLAWGVPILFIGFWQLAANLGWLDARFFPSPYTVAVNAVDMIRSGQLQDNVVASVERVLMGFGVGVVSGGLVGLAMGLSRTLRAALDPILSAFYTVPKLALLPLLLLVFGVGNTPVIILIGMTVFFIMWISTMAAVVSVPVQYREAVSAFGASRRQMFRHVIFPASLPQLFVGLRLSAGMSILVVVGIEFVQGNDGIGHVIWNSWSLLLAGPMYVGIVVVALLGVLFTGLVSLVARFAAPWAHAENSHEQRGIL